MRARGVASSLLLASVGAAAFASSAYSFTLADNYYGATDTYNNPGDVIGTSTFDILSAVVTRTGPNNDTLNIIINTNFAGAPGSSAADGTNYGSLFLNRLNWSATPSGTNYSGDSFVATNNQNWEYAVTTVATKTVSIGLYATGLANSGPSGAIEHDYTGTTTPQSYTTLSGDGSIVMSNVNGNPITYPGNPNPGYYFRQGQAVLFNPSDSNSAIDPATVTVVPGSYIEYTIVDNGLLGNTFALSWAMTCANDVIQGLVTLSNTDLQGTPLPAALPLFAGGLGVMGLLARRRRRKGATATAA